MAAGVDIELYAEPWLAYTWIVVVGALVSFGSAWSIGTNDVANAFGTSVGAKTLTLRQACVIAGIFEFLGALTLGSTVTATIAGSIARTSVFTNFPEIYMYGMLCSMSAAGIWVTMATYFELAVSTTHSIIGAVLGFALVWDGASAIVWSDPSSSFPYYKGLVPVILSWFTSPVISGFLAAFNFLINRTFILRSDNSTNRAFYAFPFLVIKTIFVDMFFILYKGAGDTLEWTPAKCAWVATAIAGATGVVAGIVFLPLLRCRFRRFLEKQHAKTSMDFSALEAPETPGAAASAPHAAASSSDGREGGAPAAAGGDRFNLNSAAGGVSSNESGATTSTELCGVGPDGAPPIVVVNALDPLPHARPSHKSQASHSGSLFFGKRSLATESSAPPAAPDTKSKTLTGIWEAAFARASLRSVAGEEGDKKKRRTWREWFDHARVKLYGYMTHGVDQDVHEGLEEDDRVVQMHQAAEIFEPETEHVYKYLQVFSACCVSFAHGSNDTANAVGPFAGIWYVYNNWGVSAAGSACPKWILAMGGAGVVLGLMTYGYNIIRALGVKMAKISPSRGYCAELAVAMTVATASAFGLPISTTHCIVGAEVGVGLCEHLVTGTNWRLLAKTITAWVATLIIAGLMSAALFAQGAYAPSVYQTKTLYDISSSVARLSSDNINTLNQMPTFAALHPDLAAEANGNLTLYYQLVARQVHISADSIEPLMWVANSAVLAYCNLTGR